MVKSYWTYYIFKHIQLMTSVFFKILKKLSEDDYRCTTWKRVKFTSKARCAAKFSTHFPFTPSSDKKTATRENSHHRWQKIVVLHLLFYILIAIVANSFVWFFPNLNTKHRKWVRDRWILLTIQGYFVWNIVSWSAINRVLHSNLFLVVQLLWLSPQSLG